MRARVTAIAAIAVVAVGGAGAAAVGLGGGDGGTPDRGTLPPKTADVTRATLVDVEEVGGDLGYGEVVPVRYTAPQGGLVTWLSTVGSTVERGRAVFRVNNEPVVLLYGSLPLYRPLAAGTKGPDVKQLEENLRALGFQGFTVDEEFTASTASAVKRWQKALGIAETGVVAPGQLVYAPGAVRVAEHDLRVGDAAGGEVLGYTGTSRVVTVDLPVSQQRLATRGATVSVSLPDGRQVDGVVSSVGAIASSSQGQGQEGPGGDGGGATVEVRITIADQGAIGTLQAAPVDVRFVAEERRDVLTVPVAALVALAEGGYGVQVVEGSSARYVAVELGMFASGRVEVRGGGLQPGMKVGVPK